MSQRMLQMCQENGCLRNFPILRLASCRGSLTDAATHQIIELSALSNPLSTFPTPWLVDHLDGMVCTCPLESHEVVLARSIIRVSKLGDESTISNVDSIRPNLRVSEVMFEPRQELKLSAFDRRCVGSFYERL